MAKWIYERWSLKWDDTGFTSVGVSGRYTGKVNIVTMVASEASSFAVGDVTLSQQNISDFNSGGNTTLRYVTSVSSDMSGSYDSKYRTNVNKSWLTNQRIKNERQADVILEEGTVPDDGIHTDGYWYIKVKKAFPDIKVVDGTTLKTATSAYVVQGGALKSVTDMYVVQDDQIRKAK